MFSLAMYPTGQWKLLLCCTYSPLDVMQWTQELRYEEDMERFQRKALKHIGVAVNFESSVIPSEKVLAVQTKLKNCITPTEVKAVFDEEF